MLEGMTDLADLVAEWELRPDGPPWHPNVLPVRSEGIAAALVVGAAPNAHLALRRWNGDGAVRLMRADPHRGALLLERARPESLKSIDAETACEVVAGLYPRLHAPALPRLQSLPTLMGQWAIEFAELPRSAPIPHRLVEQALALCRDLATVPAERVLHGNLHFANVLAAHREPWLAIAPVPLNGDPAFEIAPMLWTRWDEMADNIRWSVQRRFSALIEAAGLDEERSRAWVIVRVLRSAALALQRADAAADLTRYVTLAKAVQG